MHMNITMSNDVAERLRILLAEEGEDAVIRVRESQTGTPCKRKTFLRLSVDEREDDDVEGEAQMLPFVINQDLADQYGTAFTITICEEQGFNVQAAN